MKLFIYFAIFVVLDIGFVLMVEDCEPAATVTTVAEPTKPTKPTKPAKSYTTERLKLEKWRSEMLAKYQDPESKYRIHYEFYLRSRELRSECK